MGGAEGLASAFALVADVTARVGECLAGHGDELPIIAAGAEGQLDHTESVAVSNLAVGNGCLEGAQALAACPHYELSNAKRRIRSAVGILRREAFVIVVVTIDNDLRPGLIKGLPDRLHLVVVSVPSGGEQRMMPVGQGAGRGVSGQVFAKPSLLGRTCAAATYLGAVAVEGEDVPGP